ncbi:fatty acid desaturase [Oceanicella sp. SM1341]|uniref:fatty acid desaturase n=1 Tax=Oceanicella sp. SM1341 TaxID=1548889 RepID=UPI001E33C417|nr:fatty acid desaturase [Oceanicella sp. SM1341]
MACYAGWCGLLALWPVAGGWVLPGLAVLVTFHSSLQHECLHGHPTRSARLNEALVFPALGLFVAYRRFRETHLRHHNNSLLTDPYDDPESWYVAQADHAALSAPLRLALAAAGTLAGRLTLGPFLSLWGFWRNDIRLMSAGTPGVARAWVLHGLGILPVLGWLWLCGVPLWAYVAGAALPGYSLLMIRTFIEHRAGHDPAHRSAVIEAEWPFRLLFLNNALHAVHHERPAAAWYELPALYAADREGVLQRNGGYLLAGYREVAWRWGLRRREPVVHPFLRRTPRG